MTKQHASERSKRKLREKQTTEKKIDKNRRRESYHGLEVVQRRGHPLTLSSAESPGGGRNAERGRRDSQRGEPSLIGISVSTGLGEHPIPKSQCAGVEEGAGMPEQGRIPRRAPPWARALSLDGAPSTNGS
ncbi:hypothetical protein NPIL_539061 [Nephila pilipes]|uniref:Uncharacterized protein n=1 Tax=Nephila pilipes TaxID=299642 RepID=A0A8X6TNT1_NEPPI|nr:hypothetical protein NPIL_539061 [Nephila pilipes]